MIRLVHVYKSFGKQIILKDINYTFEDTGFYVIMGKSGEGKSTLLHILANLEEDYQGQVLWNGLSKNKQENIGILHQSPLLFSLLTVKENIHFRYEWYGESDKEKEEIIIKKYSKNLFSLSSKEAQLSYLLSGGEKARLALLCNFIHQPSILLCDEPTGALDRENADKLMSILKEESKRKAIILITHDPRLAYSYADILLELKNHTLIEKKLNPLPQSFFKKNEKKEKKKHFSLFYSLMKRRTKKKKNRFILCLTSMSIGFMSLGISLLSSQSIYQGFQKEFSSFLDVPQIEVKEKFAHTSYRPFPIEEAKELSDTYSKYMDRSGIFYLDSFSDRFRNNTPISLNKGRFNFPLSSFSIDHFNAFEQSPISLKDDEIALQVDERTFQNILVYFKVSKEELPNYLATNEWNLILHVEKEEWQYMDEQCFRVSYILEGKKNLLLHSNPYFNEYVFQTLLRFPTHLQSDMPWAIHPVYRFHSYSPSRLLDALLENEDYPKLFGQEIDDNWILLYESNSPYLKKSDFQNFLSSSYFSHYSYSFSKGYSTFSEAYMSGFLDDFLLCKDIHLLEEVIEGLYSLPKDCMITYPNFIARGNLLANDNSIQFSSKLEQINGDYPKKDNEIILSSSLYQKIFSSSFEGKKEIYSSYLKSRTSRGDQTIQQFVTKPLIVVGIIEEEDWYMYQSPEWLLHYFRDFIHIDSFDLLPHDGILYLNSHIKEKDALSYMNQNYSKWEFVNSAETLANTIKNTVFYMQIGLMIFSFIIFCIAISLLMLVSYLYSRDFRPDLSVIIAIGGEKKDCQALLFFQTFFLVTISFTFSLLELFFLSYISQTNPSFPFPMSLEISQVLILLIPYVFLLSFGLLTNYLEIKKHSKKDLFLWNRM